MNNLYVDELAKDCWNCQFLNHDYDCYCEICQKFLNDEDLYVSEDSFEHKKAECCPLKSLKEALAEERKKVVQETKELVIKSTCYDTEEEVRNHLYDMSASEVLEILDQVERGDNYENKKQ